MSEGTGSKKDIFILCLRFIVLAPIFLVLWLLALPAYAWVVGYLTYQILVHAMGYPLEDFSIHRDGFLNTSTSLSYIMGGHNLEMDDIGNLMTNVAPYIALIFATQRIVFFKRIRILLGGVGIICAFHIVTIILRFSAGRTSLPTSIGFITITLPFLLWIVFAYWDKLMAYFEDPEEEAVVKNSGDSEKS